MQARLPVLLPVPHLVYCLLTSALCTCRLLHRVSLWRLSPIPTAPAGMGLPAACAAQGCRLWPGHPGCAALLLAHRRAHQDQALLSKYKPDTRVTESSPSAKRPRPSLRAGMPGWHLPSSLDVNLANVSSVLWQTDTIAAAAAPDCQAGVSVAPAVAAGACCCPVTEAILCFCTEDAVTALHCPWCLQAPQGLWLCRVCGHQGR